MSTAAVVSVRALRAALEAIPSPAWLLAETAEIFYANPAGRARLEHGPLATRDALRCALARRDDNQFIIAELSDAPDAVRSYLVIEREPPRLGAAVGRWHLTPRQAAVLAQVVQGRSNKTIAGALGCAENTVEAHVTSLLAKAGVDSRAALVARFYTG